jgi:hypothetical protein
MHSPSEVDNRLTKGVGTLFSLFSKKSKNVIFSIYYEWLYSMRGSAAWRDFIHGTVLSRRDCDDAK